MSSRDESFHIIGQARVDLSETFHGPGESAQSPTDSSARTQFQLFCVSRPAMPPEVLPVPQAGTTTGSQAGLVSGGDTLVHGPPQVRVTQADIS